MASRQRLSLSGERQSKKGCEEGVGEGRRKNRVEERSTRISYLHEVLLELSESSSGAGSINYYTVTITHLEHIRSTNQCHWRCVLNLSCQLFEIVIAHFCQGNKQGLCCSDSSITSGDEVLIQAGAMKFLVFFASN